MTFGASLASAISIEETHPPYRFLENPISIEKAHRGNMEYGCHPSQLLSTLGPLRSSLRGKSQIPFPLESHSVSRAWWMVR
jgi:hypothetical protein